MSFFRTNHKSNCKQVNSKKIQKYLRANAFLNNLMINKNILSKPSEKRMSLFLSRSCRAGMVVEASLALPVFLFFLMNLLFAFEILRFQTSLTAALHQTGNQMAFYGYAYAHAVKDSSLEDSGIASVVLSEGYARGQVTDRLGKEYADQGCVINGSAGIHFLKSSVMKKDDMIELVASFRVRPFIRVAGFPDFSMENRYYGRAWTGYAVDSGLTGGDRWEPRVFITETGTVYHRDRSCTYLNPSMEAVSASMLEECRNEIGGKYYACEKCGSNGIAAVMFVTGQGSRYHSRSGCPALKRTVYTVPLSQAGGRGACSKCGK